jgi:hypothetical protein
MGPGFLKGTGSPGYWEALRKQKNELEDKLKITKNPIRKALIKRKLKNLKKLGVRDRIQQGRRNRMRFGLSQAGPGYPGPTSFQNGFSPYFGSKQPFVNATEAWYANPGSTGGLIGSGPTNYQSPNMIGMY